MGTFTTKLKLGCEAFGVTGSLDYHIQRLTVGQIRVTETHPKSREYFDDPCYKEEYMCFETGVGSGTVWEYGRNIFSNEYDAQQSVVEHQQAAYKQRAERDAYQVEQNARMKAADIAKLQELKAKYETSTE
jgi:hypothetical protein